MDQAEEAANFYVSLFSDSRVDRVTPMPADTPSGPAGSVAVVGFTLAGQPFMVISEAYDRAIGLAEEDAVRRFLLERRPRMD